MDELYVVDVSACIHTGNSSKWFTNRKALREYPVGGIHYLMRQLCTILPDRDSVVLCFDSPSKKVASSKYKSGRIWKPEVYSQIKLVWEGLSACGFDCEKFNGYEADDLIDWVVQQNVGKYTGIVIVGNDHDLLHSIQNTVRFKSIAPGASPIFISNFAQFADSTPTVFNTISAKKALMGCRSDTIPSMKLSNGMRGAELYDRFVEFMEEHDIVRTYKNTTNPKLLMLFAKSSGLFNQEELNELSSRIRLVYPSPCPDGVTFTPSTLDMIDLEGLSKFLSLVDDKDSIDCLGCVRMPLSKEDRDRLYSEARKLKNGEFAADNSLEFRERPVTRGIDLDLFEREF